MRKALSIGLVFLAGVAVYAVYISARNNDVVAPNQEQTEVLTQNVTVSEEKEDYVINVTYPTFNISVLDDSIQQYVDERSEELRTVAAQDLPSQGDFNRKYGIQGEASPPYISDKYISVQLTISEDYGGVHPVQVVKTFNYDRRTGAILTLNDMLSLLNVSLEKLSSDARTQLVVIGGEDVLSPGWSDGSDPKPENYQTFRIEADRVVFIFQAYQVSAFAAGNPEVSFPLTQ